MMEWTASRRYGGGKEEEEAKRKAKSAPPPQAFRVGEKVEARFLDGRWYCGEIESVLEGNTYLITWINDNPEDRIKRSDEIRRDSRCWTKGLENETGTTPTTAPGTKRYDLTAIFRLLWRI